MSRPCSRWRSAPPSPTTPAPPRPPSSMPGAMPRAGIARPLQPPPWPDCRAGARDRAALSAWTRRAPAAAGRLPRRDRRAARRGPDLRPPPAPRRLSRDAPTEFPWSLALIGLRDVRDYKVASATAADARHRQPVQHQGRVAHAAQLHGRARSPRSTRQHTADTGQVFTPAASTGAFGLTQGQPWLVNALARQVVEVLVPDPAPADHAPIDRPRPRSC